MVWQYAHMIKHKIALRAIQKLRNAQRGEGVDDFVTYRYVNLEGGRGYSMK